MTWNLYTSLGLVKLIYIRNRNRFKQFSCNLWILKILKFFNFRSYCFIKHWVFSLKSQNFNIIFYILWLKNFKNQWTWFMSLFTSVFFFLLFSFFVFTRYLLQKWFKFTEIFAYYWNEWSIMIIHILKNFDHFCDKYRTFKFSQVCNFCLI